MWTLLRPRIDVVAQHGSDVVRARVREDREIVEEFSRFGQRVRKVPNEGTAQRQVAVRVAIDLAGVLGRTDHFVVQVEDRGTLVLVEGKDEGRRKHRDVLLGTAVVLHDDVHAQLRAGLDGVLVHLVDLDVDDVLLCCHVLRGKPEGLQQAHKVLLRDRAAHEFIDIEFGGEHLTRKIHLANRARGREVVPHLGKDLAPLGSSRARTHCCSDVIQKSRASRVQSSAHAKHVRTGKGVHCW